MVSPTITTLCNMIEHCRLRLDDLPDTSDIADAADNLTLLQQQEESQDQANLLWSDNELTLYANQAISEVALRSRCIRDASATNGLTSFDIVVATTPWAVLDDRLLGVHRVLWDGKPLRTMESKLALDESSDEWETLTGEPYGFVFEQSGRRIRPYKLPETDGTLTIEVTRLPVTAMIKPDDLPEIPPHYLSEAINWMCHLAYLKNDADTKDPQQSAFFEALFTQRFGPRPTAQEIEFEFYGSQRPRAKLQWY